MTIVQPLKIGLISFAHMHAEGYALILKGIPGAEFIGIADDDAERGAHFAAQYEVPYFERIEDLLEAADGVLVCTENSRHLPIIRMAAEAGVHILCEKPLATTLDDAREAVNLCRERNVRLMTAFPMRFNAPTLEVKRMLDAGGLGTVYAMNTTNQGECPAHLRAWFVDPVLAGGGALIDHTVHLADLMRWFLGAEVVEVYAQTNHILYAEAAPDVETGGLISLVFSNGTIATIDCSWSKPAYYPTWGGLTMAITGSGGVATLDAFRQNLTLYSADTGRGRYAHWGSDSNAAMIAEFCDAVRANRDPAITGEDGLRAIEIALAAYESARTGEVVRLEGLASP